MVPISRFWISSKEDWAKTSDGYAEERSAIEFRLKRPTVLAPRLKPSLPAFRRLVGIESGLFPPNKEPTCKPMAMSGSATVSRRRELTSQGFALISLRDMEVEEVRRRKP